MPFNMMSQSLLSLKGTIQTMVRLDDRLITHYETIENTLPETHAVNPDLPEQRIHEILASVAVSTQLHEFEKVIQLLHEKEYYQKQLLNQIATYKKLLTMLYPSEQLNAFFARLDQYADYPGLRQGRTILDEIESLRKDAVARSPLTFSHTT